MRKLAIAFWPRLVLLSRDFIGVCLIGIVGTAQAGDVEVLYNAAGDGDAHVRLRERGLMGALRTVAMRSTTPPSKTRLR